MKSRPPACRVRGDDGGVHHVEVVEVLVGRESGLSSGTAGAVGVGVGVPVAWTSESAMPWASGGGDGTGTHGAQARVRRHAATTHGAAPVAIRFRRRTLRLLPPPPARRHSLRV